MPKLASIFPYDFPAADLLPAGTDPPPAPEPQLEAPLKDLPEPDPAWLAGRPERGAVSTEPEKLPRGPDFAPGPGYLHASQVDACRHTPQVYAGLDPIQSMPPAPRPAAFEDLADAVPFQLITQCESGGQVMCVQAFPSYESLCVRWIRSHNAPLEVVLTRMTAGGHDCNRLGNDLVDAAAFGWEHVPIGMDLGVVSRNQPISVVFQPFGCPPQQPFLNLTFYGRRQSQDEVHSAFRGIPFRPPHRGPVYAQDVRSMTMQIQRDAYACQTAAQRKVAEAHDAIMSAGASMPRADRASVASAEHVEVLGAAAGAPSLRPASSVLDGGGIIATFVRVSDPEAAKDLEWIVRPGEVPPGFATVVALTELFGVPTELPTRLCSVPVKAWIFASDRAVFSLQLSADAKWGLRGRLLPGTVLCTDPAAVLSGEGHDLLGRIWLGTRPRG